MITTTSNNTFEPEKFKSTKKSHQTAQTSINSYRIVKKRGQIEIEKKIVLEAIRLFQPITSRELSTVTGIERTNITRSLYDLIHFDQPQIKVAFTAKCKTTDITVQYYALVDWQQVKEEVSQNLF